MEEERTNRDADHFFESHFNRGRQIRIPKIAEFTNLTSCIAYLLHTYLNVDNDDDVGYTYSISMYPVMYHHSNYIRLL